MKTAAARAAALAEYRQTPWAIRSEFASALASAVAGGAIELLVPAETELEASEAERSAALTAQVETTGGVAVIPLRGLITPRGSFISLLFGGGGGLEAFRRSLREAVNSDEVGSILIDVDSPGGSTDLVQETAAEIRAHRGEKPIVAIANTDAASAGYYLAAQADEVVVTPSGEVGSIGVFMLHWDESGLNEQMGIDPTYIFAGPHKVDGNPDEPLSEEARAAFQATVDEFYEQFIADVAAGRRVSEEIVRQNFGQGRMVTARNAVATGMADTVATYEQTVARLAGRPAGGLHAETDPTELAVKNRALLMARERRI